MTGIVWRNLALVPEQTHAEISVDGDNADLHQASQADVEVIFVYMRNGSVIEVRPATEIRLTTDCLEVLDHRRLVAAYPRERVVMASYRLVEPAAS